jgi:hypothetical protein
MNLIIEAELINPPTMLGSFRDLTFFATKYHPHYEVLLKCDHELVDLYYHFLKRHIGGMDFVRDFIYKEEKGLSVGPHGIITVDRIIPENMPFLLQRIGFRLRN